MPQEWGHAEMTRWMDGETWRRRDEEAEEREMGDGGDGEMGGWGIVLQASKLPERVNLCMHRKCVVVARCTTVQVECLRGGACALIFGFVHPCKVLLGF